MKVADFISGYKKASNKDNYISKRIVNKYVKYEQKLIDCENIANICCYKDGEFKKDSVVQYFLYVKVLIDRYTDLELDENPLNSFDELKEADLFEELISSIPIKETTTYKALLDMKIEDICDYEMDLVKYFSNQGKALGLVLTPLLDRFLEERNNGQQVN